MKALLKKIMILTISCMLVLTCVCGCASTGKKAMKLDGEKMTENMILLLMSRMKGNLASAYMFGASATQNSFWDTVLDASTGMTYDEYYTNAVLDNAKTYLAALALFDELGLKLPDSTVKEIDEELKMLVETDGEGSKSYFNSILAEYGANYNILREAYIMEAKIALLNDTLFGATGSLIDPGNYEKYYQDNYVRFRQIFFYTSDAEYVTDENGDQIYYTDVQKGKIAYKKDGAQQKTDADGKVVTDKNGDIVWVYTDEEGKERISYDKVGMGDNPTSRSPVLDSKGNVVMRKLTTEELIAISDKVQLIMDTEAREGEYALFDSLVEKYGEDEGMDLYPHGYYLTETSDYDSPEVVKALFEMEEGEIRRVESEYGIHIVMKYTLDEGGYAKSENQDFFVTAEGTYSFVNLLKSDMLEDKLAPYKERIVIEEDIIARLSMKNVGANYHY